jgi:peptidoglycan/LPS O-acetylase OafA/YrhL
MFGTLRTLLALVVVAAHLGPLDNIGPYAVFGFYVLSGYLMTAILHDRYGYTRAGVLRYAANRLLRIYPLYLVALVLSVLLVALLGNTAARGYHPQLGLDVSTTELLRNLFLMLSINTDTRWVPPAWALTVELFFYAAMGLGLSRHPAVCLGWLLASVAYTCYLWVGGASASYRYFPIAAASLPFAMGACLHHLRQQPWRVVAWLRSPRNLPLFACAFSLNLVFGSLVDGKLAFGLPFYLNLALAWLLIAHLALRESSRWQPLDAALGELSYPVYLLHYQAGMLLLLLGLDAQRGDISFMLWGSLLTVLLAWAVSRVLEPAIQRLRATIRPATRHGPA